MNIIAIRLILEGMKTGFVVMCKILRVIVGFLNTYTLILLSLTMTHYHSSRLCNHIHNTKRYEISPNIYIILNYLHICISSHMFIYNEFSRLHPRIICKIIKRYFILSPCMPALNNHLCYLFSHVSVTYNLTN